MRGPGGNDDVESRGLRKIASEILLYKSIGYDSLETKGQRLSRCFSSSTVLGIQTSTEINLEKIQTSMQSQKFKLGWRFYHK